RYQGLFAGDGPGNFDPREFHQIAGTLRLGILDQLELELEASAIVFHDDLSPGAPVKVDVGDVAAGLQARILESGPSLLGLFVGLTLPTGPSEIDVLPPFFADGTLDVTVLLLYELAPRGAPVRLVLDAGFEHDGTRARGSRVSFDVPDAFRYDLGLAVHIGWRLLASMEINGRWYTDRVIAPAWNDNQHILEATPGLRFEITPRLVLEAGAGIALNDDTRRIFKLRAQVGLTYQFPLF